MIQSEKILRFGSNDPFSFLRSKDWPEMTEHEINVALSRMQKLGHDLSGWDTLYYDPSARAFWEVIYPQSQMHGGGPRELRLLSEVAARARYPEQIFRSMK